MKFLLIKIKLLLFFPSYITFDFEGVQWGKMESFLYTDCLLFNLANIIYAPEETDCTHFKLGQYMRTSFYTAETTFCKQIT